MFDKNRFIGRMTASQSDINYIYVYFGDIFLLDNFLVTFFIQ